MEYPTHTCFFYFSFTGLPGTSTTPKQVIKTRQIQVRQPDGSIRIVQQQIVQAPPPVKPADQKVQIMRTADGKLSVKGLVAGQQLIQMPDGKIHIVNTQNNVKTVVARPPGTPGQQLLIRPSPAPGQSGTAKTVIQKIVTPGTPNILQKTKIIASKVVTSAEGTPTTSGSPRVVTTSLQQLLAQNPGQKIVLNQGTPNQRILIASNTAGIPAQAQGQQAQQQIIVQQSPVVQQILLNSGQRILAGNPVQTTTTPVKTVIQQPVAAGTPQQVQYQIQPSAVQVQQQPAPQTNGNIAQQLASGKLRMVNYNGQQVIVRPLNNNTAMIIAHVKQQENGPAQIVVTPQGSTMASAESVEEQEEGGGEEAGASSQGVQPVVKTITAQILTTPNGPRIVLQGLGQDELSQQQLAEVQQQVKQEMMRGELKREGKHYKIEFIMVLAFVLLSLQLKKRTKERRDRQRCK